MSRRRIRNLDARKQRQKRTKGFTHSQRQEWGVKRATKKAESEEKKEASE